MPHLVLLGFEVALVVLVGLDDDGHYFGDFEAVAFEAGAFDGVVGDEAHLGDLLVAQYLCTDAVVALVGLEAELKVGIHGVETLPIIIKPNKINENYLKTKQAKMGHDLHFNL